jgi:predicted MFS family arabinose efflux permease
VVRERAFELRGRALWVVLGCTVCQMGLGFGYAVGALAPQILSDLGWSRASFSLARSPQLWVIALSSPLVGALVMRFGGRGVLIGSTALLGASYVGLGGMRELWQFAALVAIAGLAVSGAGDIAAGAVAARWVARSRGLALGIVYTGSNLGGALMTTLGAAVVASGSWRIAFAAIGAFGLLVMLPIAWATIRDPAGAADAPDPAGETAPQDRERDLDVRAALRTRSFWILLFTLLAFWVYFLALLDHLVLFLTDAGDADAAGHFRNAIALGMVSKIAFGWLADRVHARTALLLDYGLLAGSSLLLLLLPNPALVWPFVVSYGFATAARDVVTPLAVVHCFGVTYLAQIYGVLMLTLLPGGTLGPAFAGLVHDRTGGYGPAFQVFALLNLAAFLLLLLVRDERAVLSRRAPTAAA